MEFKPTSPVNSFGARLRIGTMAFVVSMIAACGSGNGNGGGSGSGVAPSPTAVTTIVPFVASRPFRPEDISPNYLNDDGAITIDGLPAAYADLHAGDIAAIRGTRAYRDDQLDGWSIDSIDVHHLAIGPVESIEMDRARLVVMGQRVSVTGDTMVEDTSVSAGGLAAIQPGDAVAVSGFFAEYGAILATRISLRAANSAVLLRGTVVASNPATFRFRVGELDVYYGQADINLSDFPSGVPQDGDRVLLRSKAAAVNGTLNADSVAFVPRTLRVAENTEVELMGAITRHVSSELLDVAGLRVHVNCTTGACGSNWQSHQDNALAIIIGTADADGSIQARYAGFADEGPIALTAAVDAIDPGTRALTLLGFRIQASAFTQFGDERVGGTTPESVEDLQVGDIVTARGTYGGTPGLLVSSRIVRVPAQDPWLYTWRIQQADPAIIVLGRSILTNGSTMVDRCKSPIDVQRLFSDEERIDALVIGLQATPAQSLEATWVSIYDHDC